MHHGYPWLRKFCSGSFLAKEILPSRILIHDLFVKKNNKLQLAVKKKNWAN